MNRRGFLAAVLAAPVAVALPAAADGITVKKIKDAVSVLTFPDAGPYFFVSRYVYEGAKAARMNMDNVILCEVLR